MKLFFNFLNFSLFTRSWTVLSRPYPRCSKSWPSTISQKISKYGKLFRDFPSYLLRSKRSFHDLICGVQRPAPWNKSEFFKTWRAVSKNPFLLSVELNGLFTTVSTVFKELTFNNKSKNLKIWKAISRFSFLFAQVKALFSRPYLRCSRSNSSTISLRFPKYGKLF